MATLLKFRVVVDMYEIQNSDIRVRERKSRPAMVGEG